MTLSGSTGTKLSDEHQYQRARTSVSLESARHQQALPPIKKQHFKKLFPDLFYCIGIFNYFETTLLQQECLI